MAVTDAPVLSEALGTGFSWNLDGGKKDIELAHTL